MKFKKLKSESGRSMVEMLGVLAIIGVLSVGGIAGYSLSMRRHRANGIVDFISKYTAEAYGFCHKKLMDAEITDITECDITHNSEISSFHEDAEILDLGRLPSPIMLFGVEEISTDANGTAIVTVYADMSDEKICQAVGAITGSECGKGHHGPRIEISIKQN